MRPEVLIVDDDTSIRETLRLVLEDTGYRVLEAGYGIAALTIMQKHQAPMVVLLDLVMPRLDGTSVLNLVRQDAGLTARNVFIVMTAAQRNLPDTLVPVLHELLISVLYKPFELNELLQFVSAAASRLPPT